jgi:purine-binding chemotaxis protein CheW
MNPTLTLTDPAPAQPAAWVAGKILTFIVNRESYGIPVIQVREIIQCAAITAVPQMPAYIKGVINLRGKIIPVANLRAKFGLEETPNTPRTCIIVVQITPRPGAAMAAGLIVDAVAEVVQIAAADIEKTPEFGAAIDPGYLVGLAKIKGKVVLLLDIDQVLGSAGARAAEKASLVNL